MHPALPGVARGLVLGGVLLAQAALSGSLAAEEAPAPGTVAGAGAGAANAPSDGAAPGLAGDPAAGKVRAGLCRTCHGLNGFARIPIAPNIGGEDPDYIARQLRAFRDGSRVHEMMTVVAQGLDDQAIADLAAWFASQIIHVALPAGTTEAEAPPLCVACHGADGVAVMEDAPNLAGENVVYVETQLKAFRTDKRTHEVMSDIAKSLTEDEMRAAADWYAAIRLQIDPAK